MSWVLIWSKDHIEMEGHVLVDLGEALVCEQVAVDESDTLVHFFRHWEPLISIELLREIV